ncbi:ribonuclease H-like domain-containing protein [Xylariaceae sp. FL0662B]|nr:ribonuclease H-like domain-containing protein [Xylariaceae sp. FL0662B]
MNSSQDFKSIQEKIQSALVATTRVANQVAAEDISFHRTSDPAVGEQLDDTSSRLLSLASSLLASATKSTDLKPPKLEDGDDVDFHWSRIIDIVDTQLEKADICLDEYTGAIKRKTAPTEQPGPPPKKPRYPLDHSIRRANIVKPQNAFERKPNNLDTSPWKPFLTKKPHALVPLEESLGTFSDENQTTQYKHPYETEILKLEYPEAVFQAKEPIKYQPVETTAATFVDTFEGVLEMLDELKRASEIAIDTEHHDFRTYSGLLSLMQISTREKDWIVDTLQPWRHKLEVLNEVFADPKIVKVLHGSYMDIIWLQRDCGLYIVGLFDTFDAAVALQYPARSLAYLLKRFVDFDADKKYQLADWRIRPLPDEMFYYARSDTHYLLYIYDMMRNELLNQSSEEEGRNLMCHVLGRSKETSLRRYEQHAYDAEGGQGPFGWYNMLIRQSVGRFSKEQFSVFRAIHKWRDDVARREDESALYVMGNATVFDITRRMPPDPKALHSLLDSTSYLAKREVSELFKLIMKAKEEGAKGPTFAEFIRGNAPSTMGIGEVAKSVFPQLNNSSTEILETKDLVSQASRLWGGVAVSSLWEAPSKKDTRKSIQFELPWARLVQSARLLEESDTSQQSLATQEQTAVLSAEAEAPAQKNQSGIEEPVDNEFTLKAGLKRKATEVESDSESEEGDDQTPAKPEPTSGAASDAEEIAVPDTDDSSAERKARKAAKKARKKARKELKKAKTLARRAKSSTEETTNETSTKNGDQDDGDGDDKEQPFDYSKAKSVLKAPRGNANGAPAKGSARFNPYGMTADGPKPARRMHGEKAGKSATFRK